MNWIGLDPVEISDEVFARAPEGVFQIMHPRAMPAPFDISNYFTSIDLMFDEDGPYVGPLAVAPGDVRLDAGARWLSPRFNLRLGFDLEEIEQMRDPFLLDQI